LWCQACNEIFFGSAWQAFNNCRFFIAGFTFVVIIFYLFFRESRISDNFYARTAFFIKIRLPAHKTFNTGKGRVLLVFKRLGLLSMFYQSFDTGNIRLGSFSSGHYVQNAF
jgi:hypothetical protein